MASPGIICYRYVRTVTFFPPSIKKKKKMEKYPYVLATAEAKGIGFRFNVELLVISCFAADDVRWNS